MLLRLYEESLADMPALELDLDHYVNRSGDLWHVSLEGSQRYASYDYLSMENRGNKIGQDHGLLDPYAKVVEKSAPTSYHGKIDDVPSFDWAGDVRPNILLEKLTMYWLNVKHFTDHKSSELPLNIAGTFSGVAEKSYHLKELGVNAVLLEPVFTYDEHKGPYFPLHFFSPSDVLGPSNDSTQAILSMKEMVKRLHSDGIEVFLEVVFTHTAETSSLRGIDESSYYNVSGQAKLKSRILLSCNYPVVQQLVLDSLRYWVIEFHIDGFCFTNASSLMRGVQDEFLSHPPLIEAIAFDPILARTKIIADCWDPVNALHKDMRFPHWKRWGEMNMKFCTDVRKFLKGEGVLSDLATRLCGSGDAFSNGRGPAYSFNFISRNFGLPLVDLVSFSNSELASQFSWNCGEEGPTNKAAILERRLKQIRNFLFTLYISLGIPILNMGDECGQSTSGSPAYDARKSYDWNLQKSAFGMQISQFISFLNSFRRRRSDLLQKREFHGAENIEWHGSDQSPPKWEDPSCRFLAMTLRVESENIPDSESSAEPFGNLFIAFNAAGNPERLILPVLPEGMLWHRLVDTALPYPGFFADDGEAVLEQMKGLFTYEMKSHTCALFEARWHSE
ncbi:hypothetical protein MLD38_033053 [Melastoma candidum]|nr:hypothetical protein MLD38_033053 [Melastoma candidum]